MDHPEFEASYRRLFGTGIHAAETSDVLIRDFYDRFFASSPDVVRAFQGTDMNRQISVLRSSIHDLVNFHLTGIITHRLRQVADRHRKMDFAVELYDKWLDCIVAAATAHDPEADQFTSFHWRLALLPGVTYMKLWHGSDRSPLDGP